MYGGVDVLVNNVGIVWDWMIVNISEEEFDVVIVVYFKGYFVIMWYVVFYWWGLFKVGKVLKDIDVWIINISFGVGLQGSVGQGNYSVVKVGIVVLMFVGVVEMRWYGVIVNVIVLVVCICMIEIVFVEVMVKLQEGFDVMVLENVLFLVVWLGSVEFCDVIGKVFEVEGGIIWVVEGWVYGLQVDKGVKWDLVELGFVVSDLLVKLWLLVLVYGVQLFVLSVNLG